MDWHSIGQLISLFVAIWFGLACVVKTIYHNRVAAWVMCVMGAATATFIWLTWL